MAEETKTPETQERIPYDKLLEIANGLQEQNKILQNQCQQMAKRIQELSEFAAFKRLDYLYKTVELSDKFSPEFVVTCTEEIESTITITPEEVKEKEKEE